MTVRAVKPDSKAIGGLPFEANARGECDHKSKAPFGLRVRRGSRESKGRRRGRKNQTQPVHVQHSATRGVAQRGRASRWAVIALSLLRTERDRRYRPDP